MQGKHLYYRCTDRVYSHPLPPKCRERGVNARVADVLVWNGVAELMTTPKLLNQQILRWIGKKQVKSEVSGESAEGLKPEIEKIRKEEGRYIKAYGAELINMEQFQEAMADLKTRRSVLERQVGLLESERSATAEDILMPTPEQIERFSQKAKLTLQSLSFEPKQGIIRKVIETIVGDQKTLRIRGYLPVQENQNVESGSENRDCWVA